MENWIFDQINSRGPYKTGENFVLSQNVLRKYFLAKFFVPLIKRSVSTTFKAVYGKLNFWQDPQPRTLQKWWKFCTISKCAKKIFFCQNALFRSSKEVFLQTLRLFLDNWIFDRKSTAANLYKNGENFVLSQNVLRKYYLAKFFVPLIKRSVSTNFKAVVKKIEFLTENPQPRTLQKWWKFCTISKCAKKIFFGKILCSTHQKKCFYKF